MIRCSLPSSSTCANMFSAIMLAAYFSIDMLAQVDDEGREHLIMKDIVDHEKDNAAIPISEGKSRSYNGNESLKVTACGWKLLVKWRDGQTSWIDLKDLKESNPIEVAEYDVTNSIVE